ncbi:metallo-beta-lactamase domain-containing protein 1 [Lingula anatina]|uniref:Metallo-beta-lactamase domain-containing protein 1 n=1 Tax=Lingula anatina TaxID=7574 RepID=A0A1S3JLY2_LINAN|nr:metallo-beta-lactamase domain-containing protein 1 [Lingula anatina]XP_013411394.1 metallo-beta-lactamase domain-containing protein 1 [Lingula anatina]|eukprot:XP_013411393.1 metallo-beta-lactamase domain-containing protein 1 [Lingula anatina]
MSQYEVIPLLVGSMKVNFETQTQLPESSSATLLKGKHLVVIDTGSLSDQDSILKVLEQQAMSVGDVQYVVCTHSHADHKGNAGMFTKAKLIEPQSLYSTQSFPMKLDDSIEIISTPGHTDQDLTVIVRNTKEGTVALTGDLFSCKEDLTSEWLWRDYSQNQVNQEQSRKTILSIADFIVPGHGPMFKVIK